MGPEIDVDPAMTANIMNGNGEVVHRSTYHGLKEDEWTNKAHILLRKEFDRNNKDMFGPDVSTYNFPDVHFDDTPLYEIYEDNTIDVECGLAGNTEDDEEPSLDNGLDREVPTPDLNGNYVNALVVFPRGNIYTIGKVIGWKRYEYGNTVVRTNDNPILDTREYHVDFD